MSAVSRSKNIVVFVGAGPGDPQLLTLRGLNWLKKAEVILYDRLLNSEILRYAGSDAELFYVGKTPYHESLTQQEITELIIKKFNENKLVVRLKGGDPILFARGAEEAAALAERNIPFEIVPGITSAIAGPALAGIPVTSRTKASGIRIVTGTKSDGSINESLTEAAGSSDTLVVLMGMKNIGDIAEYIIKAGMDSGAPAAVVYQAGRAEQETAISDIKNIAQKCEEKGLKHPAVIVIGEAVSYMDKLDWIKFRPLFGKRIVVTRPAAQRFELINELEFLGAEVLSYPAIRIEPPSEYVELDTAISELSVHDAVLFTSVNGVEYFFKRLLSLNKDARDLSGCSIAAIGPVTAKALENCGIKTDFIPEKFSAEGILEAFESRNLPYANILIPRSEIAGKELPEGLKKMGVSVNVVPAYKAVYNTVKMQELAGKIEEEYIDMFTFTSSSCVEAFFEGIESSKVSIDDLRRIDFACIGPVTSNTLRSKGIKPEVTASTYTNDGLVESILNYYYKI